MGTAVDEIPTAEPLATMNVVTPTGVKAGDFFTVVSPSGEPVSVPMPVGMVAGQVFTCVVPAYVLQSPAQASTVTQVTQITHVTNVYQQPAPAAIDNKAKPAKTKAKVPTPQEMQRIGDQHRLYQQSATEQLPPMEDSFCTCIGDNQPTSNQRWELPARFKVCGCITTTQMDLRQQTFGPTRQMVIDNCACINTTELTVAPETNVTAGGCTGCISTLDVKDKRPKELRAHRPVASGVVRVKGCACINTVEVKIFEHSQPMPKGFFGWMFGA